VRYNILKVHSAPLWQRDGHISWAEFADVFGLDLERVRQTEKHFPEVRGEESERDMVARIERTTRYAARQLLDSNAKVIRTQLVSSLLGHILAHGLPETVAHALMRSCSMSGSPSSGSRALAQTWP
jgi:hypothetical protein